MEGERLLSGCQGPSSGSQGIITRGGSDEGEHPVKQMGLADGREVVVGTKPGQSR